MRLALPQWNERISPLFDSAANLLLVDIEGEKAVQYTEIPFRGRTPVERATELCRLKVDHLVCGAISQPYLRALEYCPLECCSFISGPVHRVINSFLHKELPGKFAMPGCSRTGSRENKHRSLITGTIQ